MRRYFLAILGWRQMVRKYILLAFANLWKKESMTALRATVSEQGEPKMRTYTEA